MIDPKEDGGGKRVLLLPKPGRGRTALVTGALSVVALIAGLVLRGSWTGPFIAMAISLAVGSFGAARSGIRCDAMGVAVVGVGVSHRFRWAEIEGFERREMLGIGVCLKSGGWIRIVGDSVFGQRSADVAARLNSERLARLSSDAT